LNEDRQHPATDNNACSNIPRRHLSSTFSLCLRLHSAPFGVSSSVAIAKATMPDFKDQDELDAYYMAAPAHPRAAAILWPIIVEKRIDALFMMALRPDEKIKNELFRPSGALGSYAVKTQLAYLLGWMGEDVFKDLLTISKIRNRFAHNLDVKDFDDQQIAAWLNNLRGSKLLPEMLENARKEFERLESNGDEKYDESKKPEVMTRAKLMILEGMAEVPQQRFRWCIDLMIHKLDEYAQHMKKNLEDLPGSWLIGEVKPEQFRKPEPSSE
jgi:DNA-binding MltR family transcriptional regulator